MSRPQGTLHKLFGATKLFFKMEALRTWPTTSTCGARGSATSTGPVIATIDKRQPLHEGTGLQRVLDAPEGWLEVADDLDRRQDRGVALDQAYSVHGRELHTMSKCPGGRPRGSPTAARRKGYPAGT